MTSIIKSLCFLTVITSSLFSEKLMIKPILFSHFSSNGSDWVYESDPITTFGAGLDITYRNEFISVEANYLQLGFLGRIENGLYEFSPIKSLPYLDRSKDADGYWSEYIKAKFTYRNSESIQFNFGIFDRHWGQGIRAIHISKKAPSYPQFGFDWKIKDNLTFTFFHGFLHSGIPDSSRAELYENKIGQRSLNIARNISSHRIQWKPSRNLELSVNETVIYAARELDIHYLIPFAPYYPIENYLGDTDNLQMGFDLSYTIYNDHKLYIGFFMDELTPEWIFNSKNHNWFAWQIGYNKNDLIIEKSNMVIEYNWTDQRIYKHKYTINDYYSHDQPLGFWAGPHAEEILIYFSIPLENISIEFDNSYIKRGLVSNQDIDGNYNDTYDERYSNGYQSRSLNAIRISKNSRIKGLSYLIGLNQVNFKNIGFTMINDGLNSRKFSFEFGFNYNFLKG